ncbi:hypothetical protein IWQ55_003113 [Labrenzia sp. EL_208]|nr:hypothetical protein [Labrenzia sp. EL_132]MBG6199823.1 hypothetical protein [Labrenzia sp. EL_13]MBG6229900.1 hypothetical protein [Labrenzia sp. EL_208]
MPVDMLKIPLRTVPFLIQRSQHSRVNRNNFLATIDGKRLKTWKIMMLKVK